MCAVSDAAASSGMTHHENPQPSTATPTLFFDFVIDSFGTEYLPEKDPTNVW